MTNTPANDAIPVVSPHRIFLVGPPGSGKTTLGGRVCGELGLSFLDLSCDSGDTSWQANQETINCTSADVVALPWQLQQHGIAFARCRTMGAVVALWAHPLEMQARSGRATSLFTPAGRIKSHGGFGRRGTGCLEFRRLDRACDHVLVLVGLPFDDAAQELKDLIEELRLPEPQAPADREGLGGWAKDWKHDHGADSNACAILVDAMARYTLHLKANGASPRKMSGVYSDLDAAAVLVFGYEAPKGKKVLDHFWFAPCEYEYRRKFSDSPRAVVRYQTTLTGFASFLRQAGMIQDE